VLLICLFVGMWSELQAGEQSLSAGADVFAHHSLGIGTVFGDDQPEHMTMLVVALGEPPGLAQCRHPP
jgi:hypothetical protein